MKLRRLLSAVTALLLVCSLPVSVFAAEYDLAAGSITVTATAEGQTVTHGDNAAVKDDAPVIIQSNSETATTNTITIKAEENTTANVTIQNVNIAISDPSGSPQNHSGQAAVTIDVADGASTNVTLDGVNIDTQYTGGEYFNYEIHDISSFRGEAAVQIRGNGNVVLELDGENTLQGGFERAGVEKNSGGELTITDENETHGSLETTGGYLGAGIGGGNDGSGSNITITGSAEVSANGGVDAAGIGGGNYGSGSEIIISGSAEVTAQGGDGGSGIGGGAYGSGSDITISQDARVKAQGGDQGAGFGSGVGGSSGTNITIEGSAKVDAQGGEGGAGIGGGAGGGSGSNIEISGSAEVTAQGGNNGSGIGGGYGGSGSDITVSQNAQVKAQGGNRFHPDDHRYYYSAGAAIGNGGKGQEGSYPTPGSEVPPNTNALNEGWIATYAP
ncbi:MAG: hypothetical protein PUD38_08770, partial [Firmicutes bacterium]|nr:hypothetical protein [Bacillota bacterium]